MSRPTAHRLTDAGPYSWLHGFEIVLGMQPYTSRIQPNHPHPIVETTIHRTGLFFTLLWLVLFVVATILLAATDFYAGIDDVLSVNDSTLSQLSGYLLTGLFKLSIMSMYICLLTKPRLLSRLRHLEWTADAHFARMGRNPDVFTTSGNLHFRLISNVMFVMFITLFIGYCYYFYLGRLTVRVVFVRFVMLVLPVMSIFLGFGAFVVHLTALWYRLDALNTLLAECIDIRKNRKFRF